jgi:HlyD family secretion protein
MDPSQPKKFPFRPGMNASADIKTQRKDNVVAVPINAVAARVRGSDKTIADKKKEEEKNKRDDAPADESTIVDTDELEEVVFVKLPDGKVKKVIVTTGIQDINYIEIKTGLSGGEEVVTGPYNAISTTLKEGSKVKVVDKEKLFEN